MRKKEILAAAVKKPKPAKSKSATVIQTDTYLIIDLWDNGENLCRHAMDLTTGEYGTYYPDQDKWTTENLNGAAGIERCYYGYSDISTKMFRLSEADKEILEQYGRERESYYAHTNPYMYIIIKESVWQRKAYNKRVDSKWARLKALMDSVPPTTEHMEEWITARHVGDLHYAIQRKDEADYMCTNCLNPFTEKEAGKKIKHRGQVNCPACEHELTVTKRATQVETKTRMTVIQNIDEKQGVQRHFDVTIRWDTEKGRSVDLFEIIRFFQQRKDLRSRWKGKRTVLFKIYYKDNYLNWSTGNYTNKRWKAAYLYDDEKGIREGLEGTAYEAWKDVFPMMAKAGVLADYNNLMVESNSYFVSVAEYLTKARFHRLLKETSEKISFYTGYSSDDLNIFGSSITEVLQIKDMQKINRLREAKGGCTMLRWLQYADRAGIKISQDLIEWSQKEGISVLTYLREFEEHFSPEQMMNYIERQRRESYKGKSAAAVVDQYEDYMSMAKRLHKKVDDEMVYRARELKRRHDECVEEINLIKAEEARKASLQRQQEQAEAMRRKYPGYEDILREVEEKFEWENDSYKIVVPKDFGEITAEGMALHHCVGTTERYFDRIMNRETYICFLRKKEAPNAPYYTIEVEPGGTIRQHRGMYDEEPNIDQIKPFLREWQQEIKKRMKSIDHEYAKKSKMLREKNIEELQAKNNIKVLKGLAEDFMEAI